MSGPLGSLRGVLIERWRRVMARRWVRRGGHHAVGTRGEVIAERHLRSCGLRTLARNARTPAGEADLVMEDAGTGLIVIAEVKTRTIGRDDAADGRSSGSAGERAVNAEKRRRLLAIGEHLRRANGWHDRAMRIDIVVVEFAGSDVRVRHLPDAVRG